LLFSQIFLLYKKACFIFIDMEITGFADLCDKTKQKSLIDALTRFKKNQIKIIFHRILFDI